MGTASIPKGWAEYAGDSQDNLFTKPPAAGAFSASSAVSLCHHPEELLSLVCGALPRSPPLNPSYSLRAPTLLLLQLPTEPLMRWVRILLVPFIVDLFPS